MDKVNKAQADELLSEAYDKYSTLLEKFCAIRLKEAQSALEDCVQNTFLAYYKKVLAGEEILNTKAFLYRVADNMVKRAVADYYKQAKRTVELEKAQAVADSKSVEELAERLDYIDYDLLKQRLIRQLTYEEQRLYELKYVQRLSLKDIAVMLDITPSAVANRTSRLRTKIKAMVEDAIEFERNGGNL